MSGEAVPLPARDPDALLVHPLSRILAAFALGILGGGLGTFLMALEEGVEGHGHGGGGSPFVMLPHQLLLTLPLAILLVLLTREVDARRMAVSLVAAIAGIVTLDVLLLL